MYTILSEAAMFCNDKKQKHFWCVFSVHNSNVVHFQNVNASSERHVRWKASFTLSYIKLIQGNKYQIHVRKLCSFGEILVCSLRVIFRDMDKRFLS